MSEPAPSIRRAAIADADAIAAVTDAAYGHYVPILGREPQPMTTDYHEMVAEHPIWLLCVGDTIVGLIVLVHEPDALLIYSVAVDPAHQGRGLGNHLLRFAEDEARGAGYTSIRLFTNALMEANIARYRWLGYTETAREEHPGATVVHMAKAL